MNKSETKNNKRTISHNCGQRRDRLTYCSLLETTASKWAKPKNIKHHHTPGSHSLISKLTWPFFLFLFLHFILLRSIWHKNRVAKRIKLSNMKIRNKNPQMYMSGSVCKSVLCKRGIIHITNFADRVTVLRVFISETNQWRIWLFISLPGMYCIIMFSKSSVLCRGMFCSLSDRTNFWWVSSWFNVS